MPAPAGSPVRITAGKLVFGGVDMLRVNARELAATRGKTAAMVFQDPMTAFDPVFTLGRQSVETIRAHRGTTKSQARAEATALDVTIQARILALIKDLRAEFGMGLIMVTHDLGVVAATVDRVVVMNGGRVMQEGPMQAIFTNARHPDTQSLPDAVPVLNPRDRRQRSFKTHAAVTFTVVSFIVFLLLHAVPGGPFDGNDVPVNDGVKARLNASLGLDGPLHIQYFKHMWGVLPFDFGVPFQSPGETVLHLLARAWPPSLILGGSEGLIGAPPGIFLGIAAALRRTTWVDFLASAFATLGLPIAAYAAIPMATCARSAMLAVLNKPFVTVLRAKGISECRIIFSNGISSDRTIS